MKRLIGTAVAALLAAAGTPAMAESTTYTALTVEGTPVPGGQVIVHAIVTGKHLVDGPGFTVNGGDILFTFQGATILRARAAEPFNSNLIDSGCVQWDQYQQCIRVKYISDRTEIAFNYTLPAGAQSFQFGASYTGDLDSHGSAAAAVNLQAVYPTAQDAVIGLLLD